MKVLKLTISCLLIFILSYGVSNAQELFVGSVLSNEILRYNGRTGAFIDAFVTAGSGGLEKPAGLVFGPDGNLYVGSVVTNEVLRYDGTTGAFIDAFVSAESGGLSRPVFLVFRESPPSNVPTLSEWGLISLVGVMGIIGMLAIRRRKVTA